jgi:RimJ/RimL family protein N-acetyltransferase
VEQFFATPRLIARRFAPNDLDAFVAIRGDPDAARFQDWESFSERDGRDFLEWVRPRNPGEPGWFQFALERKEDRTLVGDCGLRILEPDNRLARVGYTIARPYWGQGYATEAVLGMIDYAFASSPIHRITASVDPRHTASIRVLEKAGFAKEAHLRRSLWFKGEWADDAVYAVLRSG